MILAIGKLSMLNMVHVVGGGILHIWRLYAW
jgi:hypothetical protein